MGGNARKSQIELTLTSFSFGKKRACILRRLASFETLVSFPYNLPNDPCTSIPPYLDPMSFPCLRKEGKRSKNTQPPFRPSFSMIIPIGHSLLRNACCFLLQAMTSGDFILGKAKKKVAVAKYVPSNQTTDKCVEKGKVQNRIAWIPESEAFYRLDMDRISKSPFLSFFFSLSPTWTAVTQIPV